MGEGVIVYPPQTQHRKSLRGEPGESHIVRGDLDPLEVRVQLPYVSQDLKVLDFELSVFAVVVGVREVHSHRGRVDSQQIHHGLVLTLEADENPSHQDGETEFAVADENQLQFVWKVRLVVSVDEVYKFGDSEVVQV